MSLEAALVKNNTTVIFCQISFSRGLATDGSTPTGQRKGGQCFSGMGKG